MSKNSKLSIIFIIIILLSIFFVFTIDKNDNNTILSVLENKLESYNIELTNDQESYIKKIEHEQEGKITLGAVKNTSSSSSHGEIIDDGIFKVFELILESSTELEIEIIYKDNFDELKESLKSGEIDFYPYESLANATDNIEVNSNIFSEDWYVVYSREVQGNHDLFYSSLDEKLNFLKNKSVFISDESQLTFDTLLKNDFCTENIDCPQKYSSENDSVSISEHLYENKSFDIFLARNAFDLIELAHEQLQFFKLDELVINSSSGIATTPENSIIATLIEDIIIDTNTSYLLKSLFNHSQYEHFSNSLDSMLSKNDQELIRKINDNGGIDYSSLSNEPINNGFAPNLLKNINSINNGLNISTSNDSDISINIQNVNTNPYSTNAFTKYEYVAISTKSQQNLKCSELRRNQFASFNGFGNTVLEEISPTKEVINFNNFDETFAALSNSKVDNIIIPRSFYLYRTNIEKFNDTLISCSFEGTSNSYFEFDFGSSSYLSPAEKEQLVKIFNKLLLLVDSHTVESRWNGRNFNLKDLVEELDSSIYKKNIYLFATIISSIIIVVYLSYIIFNNDKMKNKDFLTSLNNRNLYSKRIKKHYDNTIVGFIDIDGFKEINDKNGHPFGDESLKRLASTLVEHFNQDNLFRISGDEFVIITNNISLSNFKEKIDKVIDSLLTPKIFPGFSMESRIKISVGITNPSITKYMKTEKVVEVADSLMYLSKNDLNNSLTILDDSNYEIINLSYSISKELKVNGLSNIIPEFQPIYNSRNHTIVGYEALSRLKINDKIINAGEFIRFITNKIEFDKHMFEESMKVFNMIKDSNLFFSINVFRESLPYFAKIKANKLYENIYLEVLEDSVLDSTDISHIQKIVSNGFKIAIDDFGSKNSSISRLNNNYVDLLKIDKSLLEADNISHDILSFIQKLATSMNLKTVAEGIETKEQLSICDKIEIDYIQGFILSKSLQIKEVLRKHTKGE